MKILYFTDTHIRGTNPKNRTDNFIDSIEQKFLEIIDIIRENEIDYVIHGGDLFDRPDVSISIVSKFAKILDGIQVPLFLVSGNHDIYGHNPETINRTVLGLLDVLGVVKIINYGDKIILDKNNIKVQLTGQPYIYDIDSPSNLKSYMLNEVNEDINYSIHVVHGMLLDKPFIKGVPYTLIDDIKDTMADVTLAGHYHAGFKTAEINGKYFINPGSLVRITNSLKEIGRRPQVVIIELNDNINIRNIELKSAKPGEEVLDRKEIEKNQFKSERFIEFQQTIESALNFEKLDINEVLIEVSNAEGVEEDVKKEAIRRIALIQMKD